MIDCAVKVVWIDEDLKQQKWISEALQPILLEALFTQGEYTGSLIRIMVLWKNPETAIISNEM